MPPPYIMQILMRHWALCAVAGMLAQLFQPFSLAYGQDRTDEDDRSQPQASDLPSREPPSREPPSRELLEFLLEYGDIDEASFELIVFHGKRDSGLADEQKQTGSAAEAAEQTLPHGKELVHDH